MNAKQLEERLNTELGIINLHDFARLGGAEVVVWQFPSDYCRGGHGSAFYGVGRMDKKPIEPGLPYYANGMKRYTYGRGSQGTAEELALAYAASYTGTLAADWVKVSSRPLLRGYVLQSVYDTVMGKLA